MEQQEEFNRMYITSAEICRILDVTRSSLVRARQLGKLPKGITVEGALISLWKREEIMPVLEKWKKNIEIRRGII
jgi:hypothetical protein